MKLTQKVDNFTVFKSFPSIISCCSQKFLPKKLTGWTCKVRSIRDVFIGWGEGDGQKPAWMGCAGSLMAEMKHNLQCGRLDS